MITKLLQLDNIYCFVYHNDISLMRSMLRFQEHYESPEFTGKIFKRKDYKKWYIKTSSNGKRTGRFTYYTDWGGCNFTDKAVVAFRQGLFDPLTRAEKKILSILPDDNFYVIGIPAGKYTGTLWHEFGHAMYYLNKDYRAYADMVTECWNGTVEQDDLIKFGYSEAVRKDETQAFLISGFECVSRNNDFYADRDRLKTAIRQFSNGKIDELIAQLKD